MERETIAAVATPPGEGALAVVRVSGPDAFPISSKVFSPANNVAPPTSHLLRFGYLISPVTGTVFDEVMAVFMAAPRTYTGEDTVEITTHGGSTNARLALDALTAAGARIAEPGEFTRRAFLNGRMDLTQVEGVINLIRAKSTTAQQAAVSQLQGTTAGIISDLGARLAEILVRLEASIDFPEEEDTGTAHHAGIRVQAEEIAVAVSGLLLKIEQGSIVRDGIDVALIGAPNAGKSTLLNRLLERERSIVTDIPGTTRDAVVEGLLINGTLFNLADTAGLGGIEDHITHRMQDKTFEYIRSSRLVVLVVDGSAPFPELPADTVTELKDKIILVAFNKSDLPQRCSVDDLPLSISRAATITFSAQTGAGIDEFKAALAALGCTGSLPTAEDAVFAVEDQKQFLNDASAALGDLVSGINAGETDDLLAEHVRSALESLRYFSGENVSEAILNRIFSTFCIGK